MYVNFIFVFGLARTRAKSFYSKGSILATIIREEWVQLNLRRAECSLNVSWKRNDFLHPWYYFNRAGRWQTTEKNVDARKPVVNDAVLYTCHNCQTASYNRLMFCLIFDSSVILFLLCFVASIVGRRSSYAWIFIRMFTSVISLEIGLISYRNRDFRQNSNDRRLIYCPTIFPLYSNSGLSWNR